MTVESGTATPSEITTTHADGANGATAPAEQIEILNPANGNTVGTVDVTSPEEVAAAVARVRANQAEWEALGTEGRYHWLGKLRDWMLDNAGVNGQGPW
jgi:acyl-CoA reductase-like NAD-dependent aldehyde dehydrogenase